MRESPSFRVGLRHGFSIAKPVIVGKQKSKRFRGPGWEILDEIAVVMLIDLTDPPPAPFAGEVGRLEIRRQSLTKPERIRTEPRLEAAVEGDLMAGLMDDGSDGSFRFRARQDLLYERVSVDSQIAWNHPFDAGQVIRG